MGKYMKAYLVWLKTEFKRVAKRLPSLFIGAIVLTVLVGAIAFCALMVSKLRGQEMQTQVKVALVAPKDALTDMAISFVTDMDSVKEWCNFERYSLEDGLLALQSKEVVAVIELPDQVINSILDGTNMPAKLYLLQEESLGSDLLEIMAQAGISLLQVAQSEIYVTTDFFFEYSFEDSLSNLYGEINLYNLNLAINREELFKSVMLSETEGISLGVYYGATAVGMFTLLFGLLLADLVVESTDREKLLHVGRVSIGAQVIGRWKVLTLTNFIGTFIAISAFRILTNGGDLWQNLKWCIGNSLYLLLAVGCITAMYMLLGTLFTDKMSYMFLLGLGSLVMGYMSGYFVPFGMLSMKIKSLACLLPTTYLHGIGRGILTSQDVNAILDRQGTLLLKQSGEIVAYFCLLFWLVGSLFVCFLLRKRRCMR